MAWIEEKKLAWIEKVLGPIGGFYRQGYEEERIEITDLVRSYRELVKRLQEYEEQKEASGEKENNR